MIELQEEFPPTRALSKNHQSGLSRAGTESKLCELRNLHIRQEPNYMSHEHDLPRNVLAPTSSWIWNVKFSFYVNRIHNYNITNISNKK